MISINNDLYIDRTRSLVVLACDEVLISAARRQLTVADRLQRCRRYALEASGSEDMPGEIRNDYHLTGAGSLKNGRGPRPVSPEQPKTVQAASRELYRGG